MESQKNYNPQKRKPIHDKLDHNEIRDNVKNDAITVKLKLQRSDSQSESDNDVEEEHEDLTNQRRLVEEFTKVETRTRRRQRVSVAFNFKNELSTPTVNQKLRPKKNPESTTIKSRVSPVSWIFVILVVGLLVQICYKYSYNINVNPTFSTDNSKDLILQDIKDTLKSIRSRYKNQNKDLWNEAYIGISELIKKPHKPCIIILLGEKSDTIDCLATLLGNVSSNALNSNRLKLTPNDFNNDVGAVIEDMREKISDNKAIIIWDLLNINVEALKAFHNLCDRINPLVEEVVYIITIITENFNKKINPQKFVEKELEKKLYGQMKEDAIQPLITRITDGPILKIEPEPTVLGCPLSTR